MASGPPSPPLAAPAAPGSAFPLPSAVEPPLWGGRDRRSRLGRGGFSLVETVIVLVIFAVVAAYVVPSLGAGTDGKSVRGAANVINAQLSSARTAAIMRRRCATVHLAGNVVWTTTATCGGAPIDTVTMQNLATAFGVVAQGCAGTYCDPGNSVDYVFDPRGIPYSGQPGTWVVSRNAAADTVEVGLMGVVSE